MFKLIPQALAQEITNPALGAGVPTESGAGLAFYIANLWRTIVTLGGVAFLLYFVWGGFEWMIAGGDKTKIESAQHKISSALIGLIVLIASYAITLFIQGVFKINLLRPVFINNI
ncbi:MAG: hypothetical protein UW35_C0035G0006 [Candidatus Collierbacteria bacterium GW2011_GWF2_44_15]|uniref:Integral membrane protein n=5 Tax=Patescibacteria group TaxID=1783273 RepID=A0A0G1HDU7_9BACT|nr:MAG: hypothetical protein UR19_C0009G0006 [Candidatus Nomurabacteria bacterium GW2011_GWF1_31_48]KKT34765.1 MAG: hypothetical protein UW23_C0029G0008 [Candidatus Collierbacteria bacterium GW2011_GWA1_44_12]KKT45561.1 MAG: hypothetical protein UW35_C0035G0006 [Candidatus Collierbacteria bacterium GW2011_GWF2_44_15]KKT97279.1 MAG: hypothetical protein UW99_C0036G0006 [Candidatus Collierbacteria bacterium GW2011_GWC2_45_15]KKU30190.1 MAG: hypothetical protein UX41_C0008G0005 [Candidatus Collier